MADWSVCDLELEFEFGCLNSKTMQVQIRLADRVETLDPGMDTALVYQTQVTLPAQIQIELSNKNMQQDTLIENGVIVKDKYVKLTRLSIDKFETPQIYLEKNIKLITESATYTTNYFGFNGRVLIDLDQPNVFIQHCKFLREVV